MRIQAVVCDDNSTIGFVEDGKLLVYSLIGEMDVREGERVYSLLHGHDDPDLRDRFRRYR